ncbi:MAG TPA: acetylornithine deacetylase [Pseudomonadales bacterium]
MNTLPDFKTQLTELIAIPSMSSSSDPLWDVGNRAVVERLADWLGTLGFTITLQDIAGEPNKANLIARIGHGDDGLVLAGHTDTVPAGDSGWISDPFTLTERDGCFHGLGSTDMKGFFPVAIAAARDAIAAGVLKKPLTIVATADEESSMSGIRALVAAGMPRARFAVVGEPTNLKPVRMHKGMMMESLQLTGQSGHSSNPALGRNSIDAMADCLEALKTFRGRLRASQRHNGFAVPHATMNFGALHGGQNANKICGHCQLDFDIRPLPDMHLDSLRRQLQHAIQPEAARHGIDAVITALFPGVPAFETAADCELVQLAEQLTGHAAISAGFATEAPFLQQLGMETIVMGPGSIDCAHQPNEFLEHAQIQPAIDTLQALIRRFCL